MGAGFSKEEQLYQAVHNGNHQLVKSLRRDGASLEFMDKEGRTPLILACARQDLFDMVVTLLNLGANINAYRPGSNGGFPLHHAAKRGLERTVILLISRGADPLCINDDGQSPLDMARLRGHTSIVRIIEDRIGLFTGMIREVSGPGLLEVFVPQWVTKKVWVAVVPVQANQRNVPRHELAIYQSTKVAAPRTTISLWKADLEEPKWNSGAPFLIVTDRATKIKYKFLSEVDGDTTQMERLYRACRGIPPVMPAMGYPVPPRTEDQNQEDVALAMALDASLQTADGGWGAEQQGADSYNGWGQPQHQSQQQQQQHHHQQQPQQHHPQQLQEQRQQQPQQQQKQDGEPNKNSDYGGWTVSSSSSYNGWGTPEQGQSSSEPAAVSTTPTVVSPPPAPPAPAEEHPSAPPLPEDDFIPGPIHYPTSPVMNPVPNPSVAKASTVTPAAPAAAAVTEEAGDKSGGQCVVCWDAPAQGVCIPCGHLAGCMECLQEIKNKKWGCPVCRSPIEQVVKVFAV